MPTSRVKPRKPARPLSPDLDPTTEALAVLRDLYPEGSLGEMQFSFTRRLVFVARHWRIYVSRRLAPMGETYARNVALFHIALFAEGTTQNKIADQIKIEGPTLVRILDQLEADGFVTRTSTELDRRTKRIRMTAAGRARTEEMRKLVNNLRAELLAGIPAADLETCVRVMGQVADRLTQLDS